MAGIQRNNTCGAHINYAMSEPHVRRQRKTERERTAANFRLFYPFKLNNKSTFDITFYWFRWVTTTVFRLSVFRSYVISISKYLFKLNEMRTILNRNGYQQFFRFFFFGFFVIHGAYVMCALSFFSSLPSTITIIIVVAEEPIDRMKK